MPKYGINASNFTTPTGTADTACYAHANAAGEKGEVVELGMFGSGTTAAADTQHTAAAAFSDASTAGTAGSNPTPELFDQSSRAADLLAGIEYSAEPTNLNTVYPVFFGFNQRGGMRWAVPKGEGLIIAQTNTEKALAWTVVSSAAGAIDAMMNWWE